MNALEYAELLAAELEHQFWNNFSQVDQPEVAGLIAVDKFAENVSAHLLKRIAGDVE